MSDFKARFIMNFIKDDRWHYIADGLKVTLIVTFCAVLIGVVPDSFWQLSVPRTIRPAN